MGRRFLFEPLDVVQLAAPTIDDIDIGLTAQQIKLFRASGSKRSYNPALAHAEGLASGETDLGLALATFDDVTPEWWKKHLCAVTERLATTFADNGSTWRPLGRKPIEVFEDIWFKPAIRGAWRKGDRRDAALVNPRYGVQLRPIKLSFLSRAIIEFHLRDEPNLTGLSIIDYGRHENRAERVNRVFQERHVEIMDENLFQDILKKFVLAARSVDLELQPRDADRVRDLFRMPRFRWTSP